MVWETSLGSLGLTRAERWREWLLWTPQTTLEEFGDLFEE